MNHDDDWQAEYEDGTELSGATMSYLHLDKSRVKLFLAGNYQMEGCPLDYRRHTRIDVGSNTRTVCHALVTESGPVFVFQDRTVHLRDFVPGTEWYCPFVPVDAVATA